MNARTEIMQRLRASLSDAPAAPEVPRAYRRTSVRDASEVREMLVDRLEDYRATVHSATVESLPTLLDGLVTGPVILPDGLDPIWLPLAEEVTDPLDAACVITSSTVSCAETGTIFLTGRADEGRRELSLIPDHHICIVPAGTIVELFPEAWERVASVGLEGPITMISGPSATSDIELERVEGVHGPRRLDVVILG
ncbi:hypothetical protein B842_00330 [Corynebacterium humireducens NBRC 106098 = DSM 45392]|uniref:LUD domain-containing protein n=1 Tax=Corynebacterium humireducens NBRC 106098 = DSM 45392 TaxID=1223515 RepID=A0A0B5CZZ5_9CORY|nr:LUD domain-containing protein [Corynebacterium humireducens]AJE31926.1 hypothetical protein B842_00330 [Corynebacterium humireducens NBRC 106098 = DSM 45392]